MVIVTTSANGASYITNIGFGAECPKTGLDSVIASECSSWCKSQYGNTVNGTMITSSTCSKIGIQSDYKYCCVNNAALDIVNKCKCADANQITVADISNGNSFRKTDNGDGTYYYTCENLYCFCGTRYYGARQLMSASTSNACTKCPCVADVYSSSTGEQLCGWTANNYVNMTNNASAPSYTIDNCKAGPATSLTPEKYRTYSDDSGVFVLSGPCTYTK